MSHNPNYSIVQAELDTGIVLMADGSRCIDGRIEFLPAKSLEDARRIARAIVCKNPRIECSIRDSQGFHIEFVRHSD